MECISPIESIVNQSYHKELDKPVSTSFLPAGVMHYIFSKQAADVFRPSEPREKSLLQILKVSHTSVSFWK